MPEETVAPSRLKGWLVARSGPFAGTRYPLPEGTTRVGRSPENEIVVHGPNAATVSGQHLEIIRSADQWRIRDSGSTNGTFLNGEKVTEAELPADAIVRLGAEGPEFAFLAQEDTPTELDQTLVIPQGIVLTPPLPAPPASEHETLLSEAVTNARLARLAGRGGQTLTLLRAVVDRALHRRGRHFRAAIYSLVAALVLLSGYGYWKIRGLKNEKSSIDRRIEEIEARLAAAPEPPAQIDQLISQLDAYQDEGANLQRSLFYRFSVTPKDDPLTQEIRDLMTEFGAEVYSIPPDFVDRVNVYIQEYQGPDRSQMERALGEARPQVRTMRRILVQEKLPPDFAYVPLVESALATRSSSSAGAAGPWQFTAATARAFGLRVDGAVDERYNLDKSTRAACAFLKQLLLDFGTGSSVMLALAAYNLGPYRVKQAVIKAVDDPIKQRNFWYLYRARALPAETREYVPKVFAAIIIGRHPERYGF